jgi:SMC interacting uncharacterized protein involved in chromosome segregation
LTTEIDRIKILEGKISHVVEHINKLTTDNEKLRQQVKESRTEKKELEEQTRKLSIMEEEVKKAETERESVKSRIEALINQIDQLGI